MNTNIQQLAERCLAIPQLLNTVATWEDYKDVVSEALRSFGFAFVNDQIENIARASHNTYTLLEGTYADFEDYFLVPNADRDKFETTLTSMPCVKAWGIYKEGKNGDDNWTMYSVDVDTLILDDQYDLSEDDWDICLQDERKKMFAYEFICASERL